MGNERNDALTLVTYSEDWFSQFNLDRSFVRRVFVIAVLSGLAAALIDTVLGLPAHNLVVTASGLIAVLNGTTYASLKRCADRPCLFMGVGMGWLAYMVWYFALQIAGTDSGPILDLDWFEATITGLAAGVFGFAWFALVHRLARRV